MDTPHTHKVNKHLNFEHESLGAHYQCYTTTGKSAQNPVTLCLWE